MPIEISFAPLFIGYGRLIHLVKIIVLELKTSPKRKRDCRKTYKP